MKRLRNGFTVNEVRIEQDHRLHVKLTLPWKINTFIHYVIKSTMEDDKVASNSDTHNCHVEVYVSVNN